MRRQCKNAVVGCLVFSVTLWASIGLSETDRPAVVTDTSGTETAIKNVIFRECRLPARFGSDLAGVAVEAEQMHVGIPERSLISMTRKGDKFELTYLVGGVIKTVSGIISDRNIPHMEPGVTIDPLLVRGDSEFGKVALPFEKVTSLKYTSKARSAIPLSRIPGKGSPHVQLADGTKMAVSNPRRYATWWPHDSAPAGFYTLGLEQQHRYQQNLRVKRGETILTVPFQKIKRIDFVKEVKTVTIHTKTGDRFQAKLLDEEEDRFDGLTADSEHGLLYIPVRDIAAVLFADEDSSAPKGK